ncbi:MAG TPA: hypothetical protein VF787_14820 [Thermoanaerobaculia bacterium]
MNRALAVVLFSLIPNTVFAVAPGFDVVLVPIATHPGSVSGAFGSSFATNLIWAYTEVPQLWYPSDHTESGMEPLIDARPLSVRGSSKAGGRLLYFEDAHRVSFSAHLMSFVGEQETSRTPVPIVRSDQFRTGPTVILNVPITTTSSRLKLTVFKVDGTPGDVDVVIEYQPGFVTSPARFTLAVDRREGPDDSYPYSADAPLSAGCIVILPHLPCSGWTAMVAVRPRVAGQYWAMISETDNATQKVTLRYPQ